MAGSLALALDKGADFAESRGRDREAKVVRGRVAEMEERLRVGARLRDDSIVE